MERASGNLRWMLEHTMDGEEEEGLKGVGKEERGVE